MLKNVGNLYVSFLATVSRSLPIGRTIGGVTSTRTSALHPRLPVNNTMFLQVWETEWSRLGLTYLTLTLSQLQTNRNSVKQVNGVAAF